ncbi:P protein [Drosophila elegans]|uniref:P protein n=1 Tax=Drosophila elegans TaxID=30023 RepID=UPI001BC86370|nr:P protein [Drosophila elegans]
MDEVPVRRKGSRRGEPETTKGYICLIIKLTVLVGIWIVFTWILLTYNENELKDSLVTVMPNQTTFRNLKLEQDTVQILLRGPINKYLTKHLVRASNFSAVAVRLEWWDFHLNRSYLRTNRWNVYLTRDMRKYSQVKRIFQFSLSGKYEIRALENSTDHAGAHDWGVTKTVISFKSMSDYPVGLHMTVNTRPMTAKYVNLYAAFLLVGFYVIIVWELADRTLCTLLVASAGLALLAVLGNKPTFATIISWISWESMMLLLGNMIMMSLMAETGFFDYLAVVAYRISKGNPWFLIALLGVVVGLSSAFLDNATVVLFLSPPVIRLCEAMSLRTTLVLIILALYANVGGSVTPVGGAPTAIIATNKDVAKMTFIRFSIQMLPAAVVCMITIFALVYLFLGNRIFILDENQLELTEIRRENVRPPFDIQLRIAELRRRQTGRSFVRPVPNYFETLAHLEANHRLRKKMLLVQSLLALFFAISCFILQSVPWAIPGATLGWISILSAFLLLILADKKDLTETLAGLEWHTMLYLASLFVFTEVIYDMGFIHWLGMQAVTAIKQVDEQYQNMVGMLLILWLSAIMSAFIDNTAVAAIMVKLCIDLAYYENVAVSLLPLIWASTFGTCYGASGSLLGSMANEFVAVIGSQYGYQITFKSFFVIGFPIMLTTIVICSIFLILAHSIFAWH